jgi:Bacterial TSP3 repeat
MRDPEFEISNSPSSATTITVYQGIYKGNSANEVNGGVVYYKGQSQTSWSSAPLTFFQNNGSNQYWSAQFNASGIDTNHANDVIQYYFYVTTDGSNGFNSTYLYAPSGGGDHGGYGTVEATVSGAQNTAAASPFTIRNRAAWVFHANNRVVSGTTVQFWAKVGYIGNISDLTTRWVTNGVIYYTTDGSNPVPGVTPGTAGNASTQVTTFTYDHPDNSNGQNSGTQSIAGTAMWWVATVNNLPTYTTINYQVGFWNPANNEQKFGDYNAGDATYLGHVFSFSLGTLGSPVLTITSVNNGTLNGDYTTSHVFIDENNGDFIPLSIVFQPNTQNVDPSTVQVYTNLNRRDYATLPYVDSFGIATEEGINPPSGDVVGTNGNHYYEAYSMSTTDNVNYTLTLNAQKTGAYRLTARYKTMDPITHVDNSGWIYYTSVITGIRDHCVVVSPTQSRNIQLYELDTLNINATGSSQASDSDSVSQRGTFEDLDDNGKTIRGGGASVADLNYIKNLGCNWLWFQPIHPAGIQGRETDPNSNGVTNNAYIVGSPYSVKDFFEVMPLMSAGFSGSDTDPTANDTAAGRSQAKQSFSKFVAAADAAGMSVMLDAPFNHTSWDAEFGPSSTPQGIANLNNLINPGSNPTDQMQNKEARFYSLSGDYAQRASSAANVALAPDRGDFGKWPDVHDIYFGTYSALVDINPQDNGYYTNEGDQFFGYFGSSSYPNGDPNWTSQDFNLNGSNYNITRDVWKYFAQYVPYWLSQTGHVDGNGNLVGNSTAASGNYAARMALDSLGIDGLRADFGQGLPPQCWEYIINVARSWKWNFVFMTESLDGGAVTYRSARHFDILNENIIFSFQSGSSSTNPSTSDYRSMFDQRRTAYGQGLVLLNNMSHDEQAYSDPFQALIRFGAGSTIDGAPMVFFGQENGITGPIGGSNDSSYGFRYYEINFGKQIANFKLFNDLGPALANQVNQVAGAQFLYPSFAAINQARQFSQALRSSNRYYLNQTGNGGVQQSIFSVAKYQAPNVSPGLSDLVFAFVNLDRNNTQQGNYGVNVTQNGSNLFGINPNRTYNVKNISAYTGADPNRRNYWLWNGNTGYSGNTILTNGVFVSLNPIPGTNGGWTTNPYEAQYLKVYDISAPSTPSPSAQISDVYSYAIGNTVTFSWAADANVFPSYTVTITVNGGAPFTFTTTGTSYTYTGNYGDVVSITVSGTNQDSGAQSGTSSGVMVTLLDPNGDADGDGMTNAQEDAAGTNPLDPKSVFRVSAITEPSGNTVSLTWSSVANKVYVVQSASVPGGPYTDIPGSQITANGATTTQTVSASSTPEFYRVRIGP